MKNLLIKGVRGVWVKRLFVFLALILVSINSSAVIVEVAKKIAKEALKEAIHVSYEIKNQIRNSKYKKVKDTGENVYDQYQSTTEFVERYKAIYNTFDDLQAMIMLAQMLDNLTCLLQETDMLLEITSTQSCYFSNVRLINSIEVGYSTEVFTSMSSTFSRLLSNKERGESLKECISSLQVAITKMSKANESIKLEILQNVEREYFVKNLKVKENYSLTR